MKQTRREFLLLTTGFAAMLASPTILAKFSMDSIPAVVIEPNKQLGLSKTHWQIMATIQNHLLPSEKKAIGAKDVYATAWLHNALLMPNVDSAHIKFMVDGLLNLEKLSLSFLKNKILDLNESQRETLLREYEKNKIGRTWLLETLRYIFEALLSDPIYGGNRAGIAWKWLKHNPGFPRPTKDKRYYLL